MFTLKKTPGRDFLILNLTDPQLGNEEWAEGHKNRRILEKTIREVIERVKPDLITISGDLSWAGHHHAYDMLADYLDTFGILTKAEHTSITILQKLISPSPALIFCTRE